MLGPCLRVHISLKISFKFAAKHVSNRMLAMPATECVSLNPFRVSYVYIRTKSQTAVTPVRIYTFTDGNRNMGASHRHFTVSQHQVFT